ncbi:MAG: hypothetical protein K6U03_07115 [Firmicutes bacterium]|nr:hypothetical protein [Bacillota bacterium]
MRKMPVMSLLCRAALALYPKEFRREFAAEILASFTRHYQEERRAQGLWRVLPAALRDLLDLLCGAFAERLAFSACKARKDERMEDGMGDYRVVFRLYFAWQAKEEADWLRAMSRAGQVRPA